MIQYQQQVLLFQLTLTGAVFSFALLNTQHTALLLLIPVTSFLLFSRFRSLDSAMTLVATYIREELSPRVPDGLNWEAWREEHFFRNRPIADWFVAVVITFPGIAVAGLVWTAPFVFAANRSAPGTAALVTAWVVGAVLAIYTVVRLIGRRGLRLVQQYRMSRQQPADPTRRT